MKYFLLFLKILPLLKQCCLQIEEWCKEEGETKNGAEKKAAVMEAAAEAVFSTLDEKTTGGANETWEKLKPLASKTIDVLCTFF